MERSAVAARLGKGAGLRDAWTFVGRRGELRNLKSRLLGEESGSVWVYGPRRVGKTSLVDRLREFEAIDVLDVDVTALMDRSAAAMLNEVIVSGRAVLGWPNSLSQADLKAHLKAQTRPIAIVVDEFDALCLALCRDDRAILRALTQDCPRVAWVFASREAPEELCRREDEQSYLPSVCEPIRLGLLGRRDVDDLVGRVLSGAGGPTGDISEPDLGGAIFDRVGGFAHGVQRLLNAALCADSESGERWVHAVDAACDTLRGDLEEVWRGLTLAERRDFLHDGPLSGEREAVARKMGLAFEQDNGHFLPVSARWLRDVAERLGLSPSPGSGGDLLGLAKEIGEHIKLCNDTGKKLRPPRPAFSYGESALRLCDVSKPADTPAEFSGVVDVLYGVVFEAHKSANPDRPQVLPAYARAFRDAPEIVILDRLRQDTRHDLSLPNGTRSDHHPVLSNWYQRNGFGSAGPSGRAECHKAHRVLMEGIIIALRRLRQNLETVWRQASQVPPRR